MTNTPERPSAPSVGRVSEPSASIEPLSIEQLPGAQSPAKTRATAVLPTPLDPVIMRCMPGRRVSVSARTRVVVFSPERVSEFWSDVVGVGSDLEDEGGIGSM